MLENLIRCSMPSKCFFCDLQKEKSDKLLINNNYFFSFYDDFPVSDGHCLIVPKKHIISIFNLSDKQLVSFYEILHKTKQIIEENWKPDGFNIGINEGKAAGQTQQHLHIHIIPRYFGDVKNPRGGVRNIIPDKADYIPEMIKVPSKKNYL